ncbi:MAG: hypothetical protein WDN06_23165 [Asticcacaulis sp.]
MAQLIVTGDMALVSFIVAILKDARLLFTVDPAYGVANAGFVSHAISSYQRIMVRTKDLAAARQRVAETLRSDPPADF